MRADVLGVTVCVSPLSRHVTTFELSQCTRGTNEWIVCFEVVVDTHPTIKHDASAIDC